MSPRRSIPPSLLITFLLVGLIAWPASAATWTTPRRIPGTVGLANPVGATAPDGTDVVLWTAGTDVALQNALHARVRRPGSSRWRSVSVQLKGQYLQDMVVAPTPAGDFWVAYQVGISGPGQQVRIAKLFSRSRTWSRATRLFRSQNTAGHAGPQIALGGDGTLVVAAYARPFEQPEVGSPVYRITSAVRRPGATWATRLLTPANAFAAYHRVAVNDDGDIVIAWIQGYAALDQTVRAATLGHAASARWKIRSVSDTGDTTRRVSVAIGDEGTAALAWVAPANTPEVVRMATIAVRRRLAPWVGRLVAAESAYVDEQALVVDRAGEVTVVWRQNSELRSRHLAGETWTEAITLSESGKLASSAFTNPFQLRADGRTALLYQLYAYSPVSLLSLDYQVLDHGVPRPLQVLTGSKAEDGDVNSASLGLDRQSRATVTYTRGDYPDTDFAWLAQEP